MYLLRLCPSCSNGVLTARGEARLYFYGIPSSWESQEAGKFLLVWGCSLKEKYTSWETRMGILVYNVLFEKLDCKITQDTGLQLEVRYQKYEDIP